MRIGNTADGYGAVSKVLHWLTALLIVGLIGLGWYMVDLTYFDRWYNESLTLHKALGMVVFALGLVTVCWRTLNPPRHGMPGLRPWEQVAARGMHYLLLTMVLAIPVSGYLISTSAGKSIDFFGWCEIPAVIAVDTDLRDLAIEVHFWLAYATAGFVSMHAGAALKHQFINRDGTLARMLWR